MTTKNKTISQTDTTMKQKCDTCQKKTECEPYPFDFLGMRPVCKSCRDAHDDERAEEELEREMEDEDDYGY